LKIAVLSVLQYYVNADVKRQNGMSYEIFWITVACLQGTFMF